MLEKEQQRGELTRGGGKCKKLPGARGMKFGAGKTVVTNVCLGSPSRE